jgi:hypothetical protein
MKGEVLLGLRGFLEGRLWLFLKLGLAQAQIAGARGDVKAD